jgi:Integrase core domain
VLYAFVIVRLDRRNLAWINVTTSPTAEWIARQVTEAFPWDNIPQYLIRDRDQIYGTIVTRRLRAMGIRDKPIAPSSPWQNGFAERLIGSIRRECVDHLIVLGETHLRQRAYAHYYNDIRTHRSLDKDAPALARFSGPEPLAHTQSLADFITTTSALRFSVHTVPASCMASSLFYARRWTMLSCWRFSHGDRRKGHSGEALEGTT